MKIIITIFFYMAIQFFQKSYCQHSGVDSIQLTASLNKLIEQYKSPDAAFAITQNDTVIFEFDKNLENKNKNYYIGSCSKSFTALAMLQLVDKGEIKLDSPVKTYLPWFTLKSSEQSNSITVRNLLNQTSGLKTKDGFFDYETNNQTIFENKLVTYLQTVTLTSAPGSEFHYCNLNFILAGLIINHISGNTFASYVQKNILTKIGMSQTYLDVQGNPSNSVVTGYQYWFGFPIASRKYRHSNFSVPQGLVRSNINDLCAYLNVILNHCITKKGDTLLSGQSYSSLISPVKGGYAMGWMGNGISFNNRFNQQFQLPFFYHTGLNENYTAALAIYPEKNVCIVSLANINCLEFSQEAMNIMLAQVINKPYTPKYSSEMFQRRTLLAMIILLALGLLYNYYRWRTYKFKFGITTNSFPIIRLLAGILLSILPLYIIPTINKISFADLFQYVPDAAVGLILCSILGIFSSLIRNMGTYSKNYKFRNTVTL
jgi:CubicO group peptidase (beta-lactamase class C family)